MRSGRKKIDSFEKTKTINISLAVARSVPAVTGLKAFQEERPTGSLPARKMHSFTLISQRDWDLISMRAPW
jgi:hypothetical protein